MRMSIIFIIYQYYCNYQFEENEMGETCWAYEQEEKCIQILAGNSEGKKPFGNIGLDEREL
jgi:hypothetical protein